MERRASRIVKAVALLVGIVAGVLMLIWVLVCLTTCLSNYLRRLVLGMGMNDEAVPAESEEEQESTGATGADQAGLDKAAIEKLPLVVFHAKVTAAEAAAAAEDGVRTLALDCGVCLADFQEMEFLRLLPACQHCFHTSCIERWLSFHSTCPLCRHSLVAFPDADHPSIISIDDVGSPPLGRA